MRTLVALLAFAAVAVADSDPAWPFSPYSGNSFGFHGLNGLAHPGLMSGYQRSVVINPWLSNQRAHFGPYANHLTGLRSLGKRDTDSDSFMINPLGYGLGMRHPYALGPYAAHGLNHGLNPYMGLGLRHPYHNLGLRTLGKREADSDAFFGYGLGMASPYHMGHMAPYHAAHPMIAPYHAAAVQPVEEVKEDLAAQTPASTTKITYNFPHLYRQTISHPMLGAGRLFKREADSFVHPFLNRGLPAPFAATAGLWNRPHIMAPYAHHAGAFPYHQGLFGGRPIFG